MPLYQKVARFIRVNKDGPCPICHHPDWCSTSADGSMAICMRVAAGSRKRTRNGGFLHVLRGSTPESSSFWTVHLPNRAPTRQDLPVLVRQYRTAAHPARLQQLAQALGLSVASLRGLNVGWADDRRAWSFPMTDVAGHVLGIRLRRPSGRKFAIQGGREGLFIPTNLPNAEHLLITEGPTDCAALLDLGFAAVGRPSCTGGARLLIDFIKARHPAEVIIVADNDPPKPDGRRPGIDGAHTLALQLLGYCRSLRIILPPTGIKDARAWKQAGATAADVIAAIDASPFLKLSICTRIHHRKEAGHGR